MRKEGWARMPLNPYLLRPVWPLALVFPQRTHLATNKSHCLLLPLGFFHSLLTRPSNLQVMPHSCLGDNTCLCGGPSPSLALLPPSLSSFLRNFPNIMTRTVPRRQLRLTPALGRTAVRVRTFSSRAATSVFVSSNSMAKSYSTAKSAARPGSTAQHFPQRHACSVSEVSAEELSSRWLLGFFPHPHAVQHS